MSAEHPTRNWSPPDIDRMLEVMEVIETPGFQIATWPEQEPVEQEGRPVLQMMYPEYHPVVDQFWKLCYETSAYIEPYDALPEDPPGTDRKEMGMVKVLSGPADMESATLNQIRRYLVICTRVERFCDGYVAGQFDSGCLQAAIRRLRALRSAAGEHV